MSEDPNPRAPGIRRARVAVNALLDGCEDDLWRWYMLETLLVVVLDEAEEPNMARFAARPAGKIILRRTALRCLRLTEEP